MEFRTKINIESSKYSISHQDKITMLGSCFTENIGNYLKSNFFNAYINSHGIIYNPISIFNALLDDINATTYTSYDLLLQNELYVSLNHHGRFSGLDASLVLDSINTSIANAHQHLQTSNFIFITFGSAFVYEYIDTGKIVANCHKIPNTKFKKRLLTVDEIVTAFEIIQDCFLDKKILFTVSPVRHWRDGATANLRSKSILIESIHQLIDKHKNCFYFPAYEIVMDELRDYRFYEKDMLHPNEIATQYIWERFMETYFTASTIQTIKRIEKIIALKNHRPKNIGTNEYQIYSNFLQKELLDFKKDYPSIKLSY